MLRKTALERFWERQAQSLTANELESYEAWERRYHYDITNLSDDAIWREIRQIDTALAFCDSRRVDISWLRERLQILYIERARRRKR